MFNRLRNAIAHNEGSIKSVTGFSRFAYLKGLEIDQERFNTFINRYFDCKADSDDNENFIITVSRKTLETMLEFSASFCFEFLDFIVILRGWIGKLKI